MLQPVLLYLWVFRQHIINQKYDSSLSKNSFYLFFYMLNLGLCPSHLNNFQDLLQKSTFFSENHRSSFQLLMLKGGCRTNESFTAWRHQTLSIPPQTSWFSGGFVDPKLLDVSRSVQLPEVKPPSGEIPVSFFWLLDPSFWAVRQVELTSIGIQSFKQKPLLLNILDIFY